MQAKVPSEHVNNEDLIPPIISRNVSRLKDKNFRSDLDTRDLLGSNKLIPLLPSAFLTNTISINRTRLGDCTGNFSVSFMRSCRYRTEYYVTAGVQGFEVWSVPIRGYSFLSVRTYCSQRFNETDDEVSLYPEQYQWMKFSELLGLHSGSLLRNLVEDIN